MLLPTSGLAAVWQLDPATRISVFVPWKSGTAEVRFPVFDGVVEFDESDPAGASARISVSALAADTGIAPVNALMRSPGYLAAEAYPEITFRLTRLVRTSRSTADIFGEITFRGTTRPVGFKAEVFRYGPEAEDPTRFEAGFDLTGAIDRTEFGSTAGLPDIAAVLPVRIHLLMTSK